MTGGALNVGVRVPPELEAVDATRVRSGGREMVYFGGSDYLRLSWHPAVRAAVVEGVERYGPCTCASRMTTGNAGVYGRLERALEGFFGGGGGVVTLTTAGYLAPMVAAQALGSRHTHVVMDERAHGCLRDAAALTGLPRLEFAHGSVEGFERVVGRLGRSARGLVLTEGLFTPGGRVAPIAGLVEALPRGWTLLVDDAHGVGVIGAKGRGSVEWAGVPFRAVILTFTLSKAFGCYGGGVLGPRWLREAILSESRMFMGNTPVPPPLACGALASVGVMEAEGEVRRRRIRERMELLGRLGGWGQGWDDGRPGPMFAVVPASAGRARVLRRRLVSAGVYPSLIRYPNGPAPEYFRFALSSEHGEGEVGALAEALGGEGWVAGEARGSGA